MGQHNILTLHHTTPHSTTPHSHTPLHCTPLHRTLTLHYTALHYTALSHSTTLHSTTPHSHTPLHCTTLHHTPISFGCDNLGRVIQTHEPPDPEPKNDTRDEQVDHALLALCRRDRHVKREDARAGWCRSVDIDGCPLHAHRRFLLPLLRAALGLSRCMCVPCARATCHRCECR
jgi:hypothetical protein